jgi:hypothetical protein
MSGASWNPARGVAANRFREQFAGREIISGHSWLVATDAAAP